MNSSQTQCCKNCTRSAKLINFPYKENYQLVCTLFTEKGMADEPIVCYTTDNDLCEMFKEKTNA